MLKIFSFIICPPVVTIHTLWRVVSNRTKDPLIFFFFTDESRLCLETQKEILLAQQRQGEKVILLKMTPQQNKEDILPTKHTLPPTPLHIHPGTLQRGREELLPVLPPTWKGLSTIRTVS